MIFSVIAVALSKGVGVCVGRCLNDSDICQSVGKGRMRYRTGNIIRAADCGSLLSAGYGVRLCSLLSAGYSARLCSLLCAGCVFLRSAECRVRFFAACCVPGTVLGYAVFCVQGAV